MIRDFGVLLITVCFGVGCVARLAQRTRTTGAKDARGRRVADERLRLDVRRPATDVPVDALESKRRDDDPLLNWKQH